MLRLTILAIAAGLIGCGQREQPAATIEATPAAAPSVPAPQSLAPQQPPAEPKASPQPKEVAAQQPKPPEPTPGFEYPADLAGKAIARAVSPPVPTPTPAEKFGVAPKPRAVPAKVLNPEPQVVARYTPPSLVTPQPAKVVPTPPRETIPADLGRGADLPPARPTLPIAAVSTPRARDVNLPPAMPMLGRPLQERASLEDPTSEFANAGIVEPSVKVSLASADFLKVSLPDPFELGDQVKPKVAPTAEPGLTPVPVNPQRVK